MTLRTLKLIADTLQIKVRDLIVNMWTVIPPGRSRGCVRSLPD